jgi:hypothetical protein
MHNAPVASTGRWRQSLPGVGIYPLLVTLAFVLNAYTNADVSLEALWRPLFVSIAVTVAVQVLLSVALRSRDRGAFGTLVLQLLAIGLPLLIAMLVSLLVVTWYVGRRQGIGVRAILGPRLTQVFNVIALLLCLQIAITAALDGSLTLGAGSFSTPRGVASADAADIYLILLDGYPRADTLRTRFGYDNAPFLSTLQSMGFDTATRSHSNYDSTVLTLASMFNGEQIPTLIPDPPAGRSAGFRILTKAINQAADLRRLRDAGYEIVSVPAGYDEATLLTADRVVDNGELTTFEWGLLRTPALATALKDIERQWLPDQQRARILAGFATLGTLASERNRGPKVVFDHILAPHMPVVFSKTGEPVAPLPCFPMECDFSDFGDRYGDAVLDPVRGQVEWVNSAVTNAVRTIQASSARPPVIVIFSDHGTRLWPTDRDEMFRSLLVTSTPGQTGLFAADTTPVNILNRLINAYTDQRVPLASEESYWTDIRQSGVIGTFDLVQWPINGDD